MTKKLQLNITPDNIILSHTPMRDLPFKDKPVMVVGMPSCLDVAKHYGFNKIFTSQDVVGWDPRIYPLLKTSQSKSHPIDFKEPVAAVLIMAESSDWGRDIQVILDLMRSQDGVIGTFQSEKQAIPIYFCNCDFVYASDYPTTRITQGAFKLALEQIYLRSCGRPLASISFGKPQTATYEYAKRYFDKLGCIQIIAVGDNPQSDIVGAKQFGWKSVLVRTGVWKEGDESGNPDLIVNSIQQAVEVII
ncbi:putative mitochondrion protein, partial [Gorgonomyces haynaldii]